MRPSESNMWRLMIAELNYYKKHIIIIGSICLAYTTILLAAPGLYENVFLWHSEFWTWSVAASSYYIMIFIWGSRFKMERDRIINLLPVSITSITWFRTLFSVVLPFAFILYFIFTHQILIDEWRVSSIKLIGFMSKTIVVFPALNILIDLWFINHRKSMTAKIIIIALTASAICSIVVLMNIYILPLSNLKFPNGIIFLELLLAFILVTISSFVFNKRKSFIA